MQFESIPGASTIFAAAPSAGSLRSRPPMSTLYGLEQLLAAAQKLEPARRTSLRKRVGLAVEQLKKLDASKDLPPDLRPRLRRLLAEVDLETENPVHATARLSLEECSSFARDLVALANDLRSRMS